MPKFQGQDVKFRLDLTPSPQLKSDFSVTPGCPLLLGSYHQGGGHQA